MEPDFPGREIRKIYHKMRKTHGYHLTYPKNRGSLWHGSYEGKLSECKPFSKSDIRALPVSNLSAAPVMHGCIPASGGL